MREAEIAVGARAQSALDASDRSSLEQPVSFGLVVTFVAPSSRASRIPTRLAGLFASRKAPDLAACLAALDFCTDQMHGSAPAVRSLRRRLIREAADNEAPAFPTMECNHERTDSG